MNKKAYYRKLVEIREEFKQPYFKYLFSALEVFEGIKREVSSYNFQDIVGNDASAVSSRSQLGILASNAIARDKEKVSPRQLNRYSIEVEQFIEYTASLEYVPDSIRKSLQAFYNKMDFFLDSHEAYRLNFDRNAAYTLSEIACQLIDIRKEIDFVIDILLQNYTHSEQAEDRKNFELYLGNVPTLKNYGVKLQVLDELYTDLAYLCSVTLTDYPIVVEHLENGSLLARFSGHPLVVSLLTLVITTTSNHLLDQYVRNGTVTELNEKVEILDNMFELSKKLEEEGYDIGDMQEDINRTLKKLAKSSNTLLSDQAEIEVNDKVFKLDPENAAKLLHETKRLEVKVLDQEV